MAEERVSDHAREFGERAGQPVDLVDDDHVDPTECDLGKQAPERRPLHRTAGMAAIAIGGGDRPPAFARLALHIGGTGLALRIEAVERLVEHVPGILARVDRAAGDGLLLPPACLRPKKRGPFQRVPAIAVAAAERLG